MANFFPKLSPDSTKRKFQGHLDQSKQNNFFFNIFYMKRSVIEKKLTGIFWIIEVCFYFVYAASYIYYYILHPWNACFLL